MPAHTRNGGPHEHACAAWGTSTMQSACSCPKQERHQKAQRWPPHPFPPCCAPCDLETPRTVSTPRAVHRPVFGTGSKGESKSCQGHRGSNRHVCCVMSVVCDPCVNPPRGSETRCLPAYGNFTSTTQLWGALPRGAARRDAGEDRSTAVGSGSPRRRSAEGRQLTDPRRTSPLQGVVPLTHSLTLAL